MAVIGIDASRANVEKRTGTEWYIYNLLKQLRDIIPEKHTVVLYTKEPLRGDFGVLPKNWKNQVLRWPPQLMWTQLRMSFTMLNPRKRPDILFIPAHTIPIIHPKKTVYVAHDLGFERISELYSKKYIGGKGMNALIRIFSFGRYSTNELDYHRWSMAFAARHAQSIIAISQFTKQELGEFYDVQDDQVTVVYNGFSSDDYMPLPKNDTQDPYVLFVGRIEHKKNILNLVKAFSILREKYSSAHRLVLAGSPGYGYEDIDKEVHNLGLEDVVEITGYVPQEDMNALMNNADVFVFPSQYEGFGIPVLEALSTNTLVACSDIPPLHEVGGDACWYFDQRDPQSISTVIQKAITSTESERGRRRSLGMDQVQLFSWQRCASETWQLMQAVLE